MKVTLSERVTTALNTFSHDDRDRVRTWFGYLMNWSDDPFVESRSAKLDVGGQSVYMFRTSTDVRIFYTVDQASNSVNVVDIATKETILSSGDGSAIGA